MVPFLPKMQRPLLPAVNGQEEGAGKSRRPPACQPQGLNPNSPLAPPNERACNQNSCLVTDFSGLDMDFFLLQCGGQKQVGENQGGGGRRETQESGRF